MSCSRPASISSSSRRWPVRSPSRRLASAAITLRRQTFSSHWASAWWRERIPEASEKPSARVSVAFRPSRVSAWLRFSTRRRLA